LLIAVLLLVACGSDDLAKAIKEERENFEIHDNIDNIFAVDSFTTVWKIEDHILFDEELDSDSLFFYTDQYLMDEDKYESLTEEEQNLVMVTSGMVRKVLDNEYKD